MIEQFSMYYLDLGHGRLKVTILTGLFSTMADRSLAQILCKISDYVYLSADVWRSLQQKLLQYMEIDPVV